MLESEDQPPSKIEVLICGADEMRGLNAEYRGVDAPTDVLSFPAGDGPEHGEAILGEVAVCLPIAEQQAQARGTTLECEVACLAVHGGLHLLGYDDQTEAGRAEMIQKMNAIVASCGHEVRDDWGSVYRQ